MAKRRESQSEIEREIVEGFGKLYFGDPECRDNERREIALRIDDLRTSGSKCLLPADQGRGICGVRAIEGHSISRSVLEKVERSQNAGWIIPTDTIASKMLYPFLGGGEPSIERKPKTQALTGYFSCNRHDSCVFENVDKIESDFDFHDPERQFLFAYRAVLHTFAEVNGVFRSLRVVKGVVEGKDELGRAMRRSLGERQRQIRRKMSGLERLQGEIGNLRSRLGKDHQNQNYNGLRTRSFDLNLANANHPMNFAVSVLKYDDALKTPLMATVIPMGNFIHKVIASSPKDGVAEEWEETVKDLERDSLHLLRDDIFGSGHTCVVKEDYEKVPERERSVAVHSNWQSTEGDIDNFIQTSG